MKQITCAVQMEVESPRFYQIYFIENREFKVNAWCGIIDKFGVRQGM